MDIAGIVSRHFCHLFLNRTAPVRPSWQHTVICESAADDLSVIRIRLTGFAELYLSIILNGSILNAKNFSSYNLKLVPAKGNQSSLWCSTVIWLPLPLFRLWPLPSHPPSPPLTPHFSAKIQQKRGFPAQFVMCKISGQRGSTWFLLRSDIMMGIVL